MMGRAGDRKRRTLAANKNKRTKKEREIQTAHVAKSAPNNSRLLRNLLSQGGDWDWRQLQSPEWLGIIMVGVGLVVAPYFRGLYFDRQMLVVEQILCLLLAVVGIWKFAEVRRSPSGRLRGGHGAHFYDTRHLFIFILLIPYLIGLWTAVAPYENRLQLFRYLAYGVVFFIVAEALSRRRGAYSFLQMAVQVSIGWTALFAIAAALGQVRFEDAVVGERLTSVFQYPNTFGIVLAVGMVGGLLLTLRGKWWMQGVGGFFLIPMGYVFLLTLSRGAWLFFPLIYLLAMMLLPFKGQLAYLLHSLPLAAGTGLLQLSLGTQLGEASPGVVWMWVAIMAILGAAGYPLLYRFLTGRLLHVPAADNTPIAEAAAATAIAGDNRGGATWRWLGQLVLPVLILAVTGLSAYALLKSPTVQSWLPETISQRIAQIDFDTHSVLERGYFNQDAYEIYQDHILFGAGGGAWKALFQRYQDYPYWSTQSHNYFSQLMVETGTIGLLLFASVLLFYLGRGFRRYRSADGEQRVVRAYFLVMMLGLLGHSTIDFNMSFGYVGFLIFLSLAAWQADQSDERGGLSHQSKAGTARPFPILARWLPARWGDLRQVCGLLLIVAAILLVLPIHRYAEAQSRYAEAGKMLKAGEVKEALDQLEMVIRQNPHYPSYRLTYASVLVSLGMQQQDPAVLEKAKDHLKKTAELASTDPQIRANVAENYARAGEVEQAFREIRQALQDGYWDIQLYPIMMRLAYETGDRRFADGQSERAIEAWKAGLDAFRQVGTMKQSLKQLPPTLNKGRAFDETEEMVLLAGQLHYRMGQFQEAAKMLSPLHESQNEDIRRQAILWRIAAELQQGIPLEQTTWFGEWQQHPEWEDQLRQILSLQTL